MNVTIGIDIGTSAVKVSAVDMDGVVRAEASHSHATLTLRPGWVEQRPADWWGGICVALSDLIVQIPGAQVAALGLSGQLNGFVTLDENDQCIGNAIIWLDTRAEVERSELTAKFGDVLKYRAQTELSAIAVFPKLLWLKRNQPDRFSSTRSILLVKDYILWRLTGVRQTDPSDAASTGMMDTMSFEWIDDLCNAAGIDKKLLPPIGRSTEIAGTITLDAAQQTGVNVGVPVVTGGGDVAALAVGCGVSENGVLGITLGTAGHVVLACAANDPFDTQSGLWRVPHANVEQAIWLGLVMSGGLSLSWLHMLMKSSGSAFSFSEMVELSSSVSPGAEGVSFLPFLEGAATPYSLPNARGMFSGLSSSTKGGELVQAVMEGVAFNVRQCVEAFLSNGACFTQVRIAEGGARVDRWCQIIADVLDHTLVRLDTVDTSSLGAALMAQTAISGIPLDELVGRMTRRGKVFTPDPDRVSAYDLAYSRYVAAAQSEISRTSYVAI